MNFKNPEVLLLGLLIASMGLGQLTRVELPLAGVVYAHDLVLGIWLLGLLIRRIQTKGITLTSRVPQVTSSLRAFPLEIVAGGWILLGWLAASLAGTFQTETALYAGRIAFYVITFWLIVSSSSIDRSKLRVGMTITGLSMLLLGFLQYFFLPDTRFLAVLGWDDHYYRLIGTLLDPNFTGIVFVLTFAYLEKMPLTRWRALLQVLLAIGLALTFSRSSYLAFLVLFIGLEIVAFRAKNRSFFSFHTQRTILSLLGLIIAFWIAPKPGGEGVNILRTSSIQARVDASQATLETNWRTLILGEGAFQPQRSAVITTDFERSNTARFADNFFLFVFNGTGVVGIILFMLLLGKWGRVLWQKDQVLALALLSVLIHSLFNATLVQPFVVILLLGGYSN